MQLNPVTYNWLTEATGTPTHGGLIAQQVLPILPDLVSKGPDGYYTLNYAGFTPYLVKALQELATISGAFRTNLIAWLADATNGIHDFYAGIIHSQEDHTQKLCVAKSDGSEVCVTGDQIAALLSQTGAAATTGSVSSAPSNPSDASPQNPSPDLTNSGNPNTANSSSSALDSATASTSPTVEEATSTSSSNSDATTSLPVLESAPPLVPDYSASTTIPADASSTAQ
jgi:hypothetical protein